MPLHAVRGFMLARTGHWLGRYDKAEREERFVSYLHEMMKELGYDDGKIVAPGPGRLRETRKLVRKIESASKPDLAVRCFPRVTRKARAPEYCAISRLVSECGIAAPKLVHVDSSYTTLGRHRFEVVAEEWLYGRQPEANDFKGEDSPWLRLLAEQLTAIHRRESPEAGRTWRERESSAPFLTHLFDVKLREALENLKRSEVYSEIEADWDAVGRKLAEGAMSLDVSGPYSLVYGDYQPQNLLLSEDGSPAIGIIDFDTFHYGHWEWEFVKIFNRLFDRDETTFDAFLGAYFGLNPGRSREAFNRAFSHLELYYHVEKAGSTAEKLRKEISGRRETKKTATRRATILRSWERAVEAMERPVAERLG